MELDIVDKIGEWYAGAAPLGLRDPTTQVFFVFNRPVKVKKSEWMAGQIAAGTIKPCPDPLSDIPAMVPTAKVPIKAANILTATVTAK